MEELDQLEDDPPLGLSELAISLVRQTIIGHGDKLVRLYAAKAIAEILRVYAPDAPYEDEDLRVCDSCFTYVLLNVKNIYVQYFWSTFLYTCVTYIIYMYVRTYAGNFVAVCWSTWLSC